MKTITLTVNNRPQYLRQTLDSLSRNRLEGYHLYCQLEPDCEECRRICEEIDFVPTTLYQNYHRRGVRDNPFSLLTQVFQSGSEGNVYLEDDIVLSPDAFDLADWFLQLQTQKSFLCLSLFNPSSTPDAPWEVTHGPFSSLGFVLTKVSWFENFVPAWHRHPKGWDFGVVEIVDQNKDLCVLVPKLARSNHIGREGGTHCSPDFHDRTFATLPISTTPCNQLRRYSCECMGQ